MAKKNEVDPNAWMNTYADMVTLLMTFFVLLYSMSSLDSQKFHQIASSFQEMFTGKSQASILDFNMSNGDVPIVGQASPSEEAAEKVESEDDEVLKEVSKYVEENGMSDQVQVYENEKGVNLELKEKVLFDTGKADLRSDSISVLTKINDLFKNTSGNIIIEGHTDNVPIKNSRYPSNFYLASDRALSVLDFFLSKDMNHNPERFSTKSCGEYEPVAPNDTEENKAKNRRVNIIIVSQKKEQ